MPKCSRSGIWWILKWEWGARAVSMTLRSSRCVNPKPNPKAKPNPNPDLDGFEVRELLERNEMARTSYDH